MPDSLKAILLIVGQCEGPLPDLPYSIKELDFERSINENQKAEMIKWAEAFSHPPFDIPVYTVPFFGGKVNTDKPLSRGNPLRSLQEVLSIKPDVSFNDKIIRPLPSIINFKDVFLKEVQVISEKGTVNQKGFFVQYNVSFFEFRKKITEEITKKQKILAEEKEYILSLTEFSSDSPEKLKKISHLQKARILPQKELFEYRVREYSQNSYRNLPPSLSKEILDERMERFLLVVFQVKQLEKALEQKGLTGVIKVLSEESPSSKKENQKRKDLSHAYFEKLQFRANPFSLLSPF
ncbi:MAG: hypothetical protein JSS09_05950 [Verrucomicrobia bacterium]|nr:hypothetical protein [Verrucomicrobiota bacterium]